MSKGSDKDTSHTAQSFQLKWLLPTWCYRSMSYFYWSLALVLSIIIVGLAVLNTKVGGVDPKTFDTVMKMRWATPLPSHDIVILDIDERSLAEMAADYGRFPWKRKVFAEVLAELEFAEAKSIIFTVLIADPDKNDEHSDATLSYVASESFVTVYPLVRLPSKNDIYSKLSVCDVIPLEAEECKTDKTIAAILPVLPGMRHDLGMTNHRPDSDGILRQWSLSWSEGEAGEEGAWSMPTMVGRALELADISPLVESNEAFTLNWRGHKTPYHRISFSDYLASLNGESRIPAGFFNGKHVIISASAPGLTVYRGTSDGIKSDGEILATAMDDAIHGTHLKPIPVWLVTLLTILFIWGMAFLFMYGRSQRRLDKFFVAMQSVAVVVMALTINYTTYFLDLAPLFTFGFYYYVIGRIHHMMADRVFMGDVGYLAGVTQKKELDSIGIIAFKRDSKHFLLRRREMVALQLDFEGAELFFCHNSFEANKLLAGNNNVEGIVVLGGHASQVERMQRLESYLDKQGLQGMQSQVFDFPDAVKNNRTLAPEFMAMKTLYVVSLLPLGGDEALIE